MPDLELSDMNCAMLLWMGSTSSECYIRHENVVPCGAGRAGQDIATHFAKDNDAQVHVRRKGGWMDGWMDG